LSDPAGTTFLLDVRTAEDYAADHLAGARHAPGGQLLQATDRWIGVREGACCCWTTMANERRSSPPGWSGRDGRPPS